MTRDSKLKLIPALVLGLFSGHATASGFQLIEQGSGLGNAFAGSASKADDASTIFYNPAGMTQLQAREVSGGLAAINTSFKFTDQDSNVAPGLTTAGAGGDAGGWGFVPNGYLSWALNKDLYVGVGVGAPFGLKTEYDSPWIGAAQAISFDIKTYNINPSVAYRVSDSLSLGAGVNWQRIKAQYIRLAGTTAGTSLVTSDMNLEDDSLGWNIGVLISPSPSTKIGLSYRSQIEYSTNGDVKLTGDGSLLGNGTASALIAAGRQSNLSAKITVPDTLILSVNHKLDNLWEVLGDVSWTGWSSIPKVDIVRTSGLLTGQIAQTLDTNFRDTWRMALGANYRYTDSVKLKFGVASLLSG